jgi:hypothetical protein
MMNWKGFGKKQPWPNQSTVVALSGGTEKIMKTSVRIMCILVEI